MDRAQLRTLIGDELFALAGALASDVVASEPLRGRGPCSSFRLTLADGRVLKVKRLPSLADAERVEQLLGLLAHPGLPAVCLRRGAAIATPWVPGRRLDAQEADADVLRGCGALHALVHAPRAAAGPARGQWRSRQHRRQWLAADLATLVDGGWLERQQAGAVQRIIERDAPADWTLGIVHGDLNPENLIAADAGGVAAVDNETVSIGPQAYDLARTWYRWPMNAAQRAAYCQGYGSGGGLEELDRHFPFWALTVLARGAAFRVRAGRAGVDEPLARLRAGLEAWG